MSDDTPRTDLLREIEVRQDQVLAELDALEKQLDQLLAEYGFRDDLPRVHQEPRRDIAA